MVEESRPPMKQGLWVWPSEASAQRSVARRVFASDHMMTALKAIAKSKEGLSNAEVDDAISDNSEWMTLWVLRQLMSLGFIEYKVDFFGGPGKYNLTELGRNFLSKVTGVPVPPPTATPVKVAPPQSPQPAKPTSAPQPASPQPKTQ